MKNFVFFCGIWNCLFFNLSGSEIGFKLSNLNTFCEAYEEQPNEFYNRRNLNVTDNDENLLMELLLDHANFLAEIEKKELEEDIKVWFKSYLDSLFYLQNPLEYETYKKSLLEDLEWFKVLYSDLPVINLLEKFLESSCDLEDSP